MNRFEQNQIDLIIIIIIIKKTNKKIWHIEYAPFDLQKGSSAKRKRKENQTLALYCNPQDGRRRSIHRSKSIAMLNIAPLAKFSRCGREHCREMSVVGQRVMGGLWPGQLRTVVRRVLSVAGWWVARGRVGTRSPPSLPSIIWFFRESSSEDFGRLPIMGLWLWEAFGPVWDMAHEHPTTKFFFFFV